MSSEQLDVFKVLLGLGAGLTLFLYGVTRLSDGLRAIAGDRMRELLARFTNNRFAGLASGHGCDDGSGLVVGRHHHGDRDCQRRPDDLCPITRRRAGREHGTTVSSQIIALDVEEYATVPLVLGLAIHAYGRWRGNDGLRNAGMAILVLGMVFFGLATMGDSMSPLKDFKPFIDLMASLQNPIAGVLVGALVTLLIQYSSATVAIVITLASQGLVSLPTGVALMLWAEIGTCADSLLASIGRSPQAVRTGLFHLCFNIFIVTLGVLFVTQLVAVTLWLPGGGDVPREIANAHVVFNVSGALLLIPFTPWIARLFEGIVPEKSEAGAPARRPVYST